MRDRTQHPACRPPGSSGFLPALLLAVALPFVLPGTASSRGDEYSGARTTTAGSLEDHQAESIDPSSLEVESGEMQPGYSEDPADMVVDSEEMDAVSTGQLADHEGSSTDLQDLRGEKPVDGFETIDDGRLKGIDDTNLTAEQLVAKRHLERAQAAAEVARTRYGDMMRDNYPRGAARIRITDHRDESMSDLDKARADFDQAMGN